MKESFLISAEPMTLSLVAEDNRTLLMVTLTLYAAIGRAGHVDRHAVSIPTFPEASVAETSESRCSIETHFQVMEGRGRIGVINDDIKHFLGPEFIKKEKKRKESSR